MFTQQQQQSGIGRDTSPLIFIQPIRHLLREPTLFCVLMKKTSSVFSAKSPWTVTGTRRISTSVEAQGTWCCAAGGVGFLDVAFPCDMLYREMSDLLSSPPRITLFMVCSYVPPLLPYRGRKGGGPTMSVLFIRRETGSIEDYSILELRGREVFDGVCYITLKSWSYSMTMHHHQCVLTLFFVFLILKSEMYALTSSDSRKCIIYADPAICLIIVQSNKKQRGS